MICKPGCHRNNMNHNRWVCVLNLVVLTVTTLTLTTFHKKCIFITLSFCLKSWFLKNLGILSYWTTRPLYLKYCIVFVSFVCSLTIFYKKNSFKTLAFCLNFIFRRYLVVSMSCLKQFEHIIKISHWIFIREVHCVNFCDK